MATVSSGPFALFVAIVALGAPSSVASLNPRVAAPIPMTVLVHVVDSASRRPMPNAEVTATRSRRLTDAQGNARFTWPEDGTLRIRVRQIGFRYEDRTLKRSTSSTATVDTVVVVMSNATFALPQVVTEADVRCDAKLDPATLALSTSSMELLRFGAEQYNSFRAAYPFNVSLSRRTVRSASIRGPRVLEEKESAESETYGDVYLPGKVLLKTPTGYFVPILFVATLADSAFWARHCFVARGVRERDGRRVIQLDFTTARGIRDVEWEGSAWIDSAASVLRRIDFKLVNMRGRTAPRRFEGYTIFAMPSPYIAVPDSTVAWWWTEFTPDAQDDKFTAEVLQFLSTQQLSWRNVKPPEVQR